MQAKLFRLDDLLNRFADVTEPGGSRQVPPLPCKGNLPNKEDKYYFPLAMHLDFYVNANMNVEKAPNYAFNPIFKRQYYMKNRSIEELDENYRSMYT